MAIDNPPIYSGITFNSQFFVEETGGLSEAQANALYLRKTFPDTATALETFNSGIQTNAVSPLTGGSLALGTTNDLVLNVGTGTRSTAIIHHYSDADNAIAGANVYLNNGIANLSETQIHSGSSSVGSVYIAAAAGSSSQIYIGNQVSANTTTNMNGNTILTKPQINTLVGTTPSSTINLYNATTTSNITLGSGQTSGSMIFASGTNRTGNTSIASFTKGNILIGDAMASGGTGLVTIGTSSVGSITLNSGTQLNIGTSGSGQITMGKLGANTTVTGNNTYLRANATLNIGDLGVGSISIGNSTLSSLTINNPLTLNYTTAPSTNQIGGISASFNATGLPLTTSPFVTISMTTDGLPLGNYIGRVYMHINPSAATAKVAFGTSGGSGISITGANDVSYNASGTAADGFDNNLVFFFTVTNATTSSISYVMYSATANSTITTCYLQAMRIG